ncbi:MULTISPECIES: hypothetical protein [unclassified Pseudomonas]|uniref:hypothetical protein n=1 Tax=Pseudomonas TaxID=286 RepID=UPI001472984C|nr:MULTISPECIES: hypothetical protein [unclassified Pseudomonas]MBW8354231.1 hypothetical protein [Pseudomonas sp.]NMY67566.1 hypothetical protein [Pseudomonas sp. WS 5414]
MIKVGFVVLEAVLAPIIEPQEPLYSKLACVDGEDERQLREVISEYVRPYYDSFDTWSKGVISSSILYFFHVGCLPGGVSLESLPVPFDFPQDLRVICSCLIDGLAIERRGIDVREYEYCDELSLVHRLRRNRN